MSRMSKTHVKASSRKRSRGNVSRRRLRFVAQEECQCQSVRSSLSSWGFSEKDKQLIIDGDIYPLQGEPPVATTKGWGIVSRRSQRRRSFLCERRRQQRIHRAMR